MQMTEEKGASKWEAIADRARICFELDDTAQLEEVCGIFDAHAQVKPSLKKSYPIFSFYRLYLQGEYEQCVSFCRQREEQIRNKSRRCRLAQGIHWFNLALSYYKMADLENAREYFAKVMELAPKLHLASLSRRYTESIQSGESVLLSFGDVQEGEGVLPQFNKKVIQTVKKLKRIAWIAVAICLVSGIGLHLNGEKQKAEYEELLHTIIDRSYHEYELLGYCNVKAGNGEFVDGLVLIRSEGKMDVLSLVEYSNGNSVAIKLGTDLQMGECYTLEGVIGPCKITVYLSREKPKEKQSHIQYTAEGGPCYFIVNRVEK